MIESVLKYTSENVGEFVKYTIFRKNKSSGIYMICYLAAMVLFAVAGVVLAVAFALKKYTNEIFGINSKNEYDAIEITAGSIVLKNGGAAKAIADWTAVASVDFYKSSAYIVTHDGYLFIINESDIKEGSLDELRQITEEKLVKTDD